MASQPVGQGTVLAGRYTASTRLHSDEAGPHERWRAHDDALDREVVLVLFPSSSDLAAPALDAARRAVGVEDPRLVRILDVGADGGWSFIVEEPLEGAVTLAQLINGASPYDDDDAAEPAEPGASAPGAGLVASEVRRLVGEAARALEVARQRGLHHLVLGPESLLRMPEGTVKVRGLATESVLQGADRAYDEAASRVDAVGLVKLVYAGLTGRWPTARSEGGTRVSGGRLPAAPSIVGGVPQPAELAVGVPADLDGICRLTLNQDEGPLNPGDLASQIAPWSNTMVLPEAERSPFDPPASDSDPGSTPDAQPDAAAATSGTAKAGAAIGAAGAVAVGAAGAAAERIGSAGQRVGSFARAAADRATARAAERRTGREGGIEEEEWDGEDVDLDTAFDEGEPATVEPPLPLLTQNSDTPNKAQTRIALAIVGALVLVAMFLAIQNVLKIGQPSDEARPTVTVTAGQTGGAPGATSGAPAPATTAAPAPAPASPVTFTNARGFDPQDGQENDGSARDAIDGNADTMWRSRWYGTANFNGKPGLGLILDLDKRRVSEVTVTLPAAQPFVLYGANGDSLDGAVELGKGGNAGPNVIAVPATAPEFTRLIVWVTQGAPADGPNRFRAQISEVSAK